MKIQISVLLLLCSYVLFAQATPKKTILLDENGKYISATDFKKTIASPEHKYTFSRFENDTAVFAHVILRKQTGFLSAEQRNTIADELYLISGRKVNKKQVIIINFFTTQPIDTDHDINFYTIDGSYKRFFKQHPEHAQFFITEKGFIYNKDFVFEDRNSIIQDMLFRNLFLESYIIIKPDGSFYRQVGEYRQDEIPEKIMSSQW